MNSDIDGEIFLTVDKDFIDVAELISIELERRWSEDFYKEFF